MGAYTSFRVWWSSTVDVVKTDYEGGLEAGSYFRNLEVKPLAQLSQTHLPRLFKLNPLSNRPESLNGESIQQQKTDGHIWNKLRIAQWPVSETDIAVAHSLDSLNF